MFLEYPALISWAILVNPLFFSEIWILSPVYNVCFIGLKPASGKVSRQTLSLLLYLGLHTINLPGTFHLLCPLPLSSLSRDFQISVSQNPPQPGTECSDHGKAHCSPRTCYFLRDISTTWHQPPGEKAEPVLQTYFLTLGEGSSMVYIFEDP